MITDISPLPELLENVWHWTVAAQVLLTLPEPVRGTLLCLQLTGCKLRQRGGVLMVKSTCYILLQGVTDSGCQHRAQNAKPGGVQSQVNKIAA